MEQIIKVSHQQVQTENSYEDFTKNLEKNVGHLKQDYADKLYTDPESVRNYLVDLAGDRGLMIFSIHRHGDMLNIYGKPRKAKQYVIGNPVIAISMTVHDIRAALYAPLRIVVYEGEDTKTYIEYDLPSTLFGQFGNDEVLEIAKDLDKKLLYVINEAASNA